MNYKNFTIITKIIINMDDFDQTNPNNDILSYIDDLFGDLLLPEGEEIQAIDIYDRQLLSILNMNKSAIESHISRDNEARGPITINPQQRSILQENNHFIWPENDYHILQKEIVLKFFKIECIHEEREILELGKKFMFYLCPQCAHYFSEYGSIVTEIGIPEECATKHCNGDANLLFMLNNDRIMEMDDINPPIISINLDETGTGTGT